MDDVGERQLKAVVHRCPFCHEGAEAEGSVVCQGCLARHHEPCWTEAGGRCGSCGSQQALAPMARPALTIELVTAAMRSRGYPAGEVEGFFATLKAPPATRRGLRASQVVAVLVALVALALLGLQVARRWEMAEARQWDLEARQRNLQAIEERHQDLEAKQAALMKELEDISALGVNTSVSDERRRERLADELLDLLPELERSERDLIRAKEGQPR